MVKLPQAIKQLLTQRNPNPFNGPPTPKLTGVLSRTRNEARIHGAENGWLVLSVCGFRLVFVHDPNCCLPGIDLHASYSKYACFCGRIV